MNTKLKAIAAMSENRVIARDGQLPWHLPEDFKWFKQMTSGSTIVMGRKTWESLPEPLPNRRHVVLSRSGISDVRVETLASLEDFDPDNYQGEVFVIGGGEIFRQMLPQCGDLYLTVVKRVVEGDTYFPEWEDDFAFVATLRETPEFEIRHYRNRRLLLA